MIRISLVVALALIVMVTYGTFVSGADAKSAGNNEDNQLDTDNLKRAPSRIYVRKIPLRKIRNFQLPNFRTHGEYQPLLPPVEVEVLDENTNDFDKRFDDYGHMRFGKRGEESFGEL